MYCKFILLTFGLQNACLDLYLNIIMKKTFTELCRTVSFSLSLTLILLTEYLVILQHLNPNADLYTTSRRIIALYFDLMDMFVMILIPVCWLFFLKKEVASSQIQRPEGTDFAALMVFIYSMLKQDYVMQVMSSISPFMSFLQSG